MDMIGKVRRLRLRKKLTISEIAKVTGISRPTVRKWLSADVASPPQYERVGSQTKLSAFKQTLEQAADAHRPKHARRTGQGSVSQAQSRMCLSESVSSAPGKRAADRKTPGRRSDRSMATPSR